MLLVLGLFLSAPPRAAVAALQTDLTGPAGSGQFGATVLVLPNGNIVVTDPAFNGTTGAAYLYNGATGALISTLTGSAAGDWVGGGGVTVLSNGNYVVRSPNWDNGGIGDGGAVTWGDGASGTNGPINGTNSVLGLAVNGGPQMNFSYDAFNWQLVVGRPAENIVTLFRLTHSHVFMPVVRK